MKFLFALQGEGRGHMTQALTLAGMLRREGHEIAAVLVGTGRNRKLPEFFIDGIGAPVTVYEAPAFVFDGNNRKVDIPRTLLRNMMPSRLMQFMKSMRKVRDIVKEHDPDRIVNFYEITASLSKVIFGIRVPMTGIAHQFLFNHRDYPFSSGHGLQGWLLRKHAALTGIGCECLLGLSFRKMETDRRRNITAVPPLLRKEALSGKTEDGGFILGYMVNCGFADEVHQWCSENPGHEMHVFWDNREAPEVLDAGCGLHFHRLDDVLFLEMMKRCSFYISTAGFESVCEARYRSKPMVLVPTHIEQTINAEDAAYDGNCLVSDVFSPEKTTALKPCSAVDVEFVEWVDSASETIIPMLVREC